MIDNQGQSREKWGGNAKWTRTHGASGGLFSEFGEDRVLDCPLSENAFVGAAVGAAAVGTRPIVDTAADSIQAATLMDQMGVGCLVTLGGDGTNRVVAKSCGQVPLVPISTGTNNVFPPMVEGTLAGLAAGVVAQGWVEPQVACYTSKRIEVYLDGVLQDIALVDVAVSKERFVASRAVWDMTSLHEVFLTRAEPFSLGLSSIGARLQTVSTSDTAGLYLRLGSGGTTVVAPVAPGLVSPVAIAAWRLLPLDQRVRIELHLCTIALDGEREFSVLPGQGVEVAVRHNGPQVVKIEDTLRSKT